jgi:F0F1-type ATP synthase epsilon subunit
MKLNIVSPFAQKTFDITWIEINTPAGNFVIQPGHAPMVVALSAHKDITICLTNGKQQNFFIKQGIIDITRTTITVLSSEEIH